MQDIGMLRSISEATGRASAMLAPIDFTDFPDISFVLWPNNVSSYAGSFIVRGSTPSMSNLVLELPYSYLELSNLANNVDLPGSMRLCNDIRRKLDAIENGSPAAQELALSWTASLSKLLR